MSFSSLPSVLAQALAARGYDQPTPVQAAVLQGHAQSTDLLVSAQTGSGKTIAFGLAMATDLLRENEALPPATAPLALVVAPTRELAMQVHTELSWLYAEAGGRVLACVGGMDPRREQRLLAAGAHIVVGTPGRLGDHIRRKQLDMSMLKVVVLDEADEMLDLGFREELESILDASPSERRTLLFSATLPREIARLAQRYQKNALRLDMGGSREQHDDITYNAFCVAAGETTPAVINVLRYHEARIAIVFCPTREAVRALWTALTARGFLAVALSGEMGQSDRNQALLSLRTGRARVCVATDVAARGLDLPELSLVIHAELPINPQLLLHRSGRTGRAGRKGTSVLLVAAQRRRRAEALLAQAGVTATWGPVPDMGAIRERDDSRLLADPILATAPDEEEIAAAAALVAQHTPQAMAIALLRLHRAGLPEEAIVTPLAVLPPSTPPSSSRASKARKPDRLAIANPVWLSASIGRREKVDLKWLLPVLCRMGRVSRQDIGAVRIMGDETRFEVSNAVAGRFMASDAPSSGERSVRVVRALAPAPSTGKMDHKPVKRRWAKQGTAMRN